MSRTTRSVAAALLAAGAAVAVGATPALAGEPDLVLPAGAACEYDLGISFTDMGKMHVKEFTDPEGNLLRAISAGTGLGLTFTNMTTREDLALRSNGAVTRTTYNDDGSTTNVATGHNVLIWFPTDVPPGPSTTLVVGRAVYTIGADGVWTLESVTGRTTDICAELSD